MKIKFIFKPLIQTILLLILSLNAFGWCIVTPPEDAPYFRVIENIIQGIEKEIPDINLYRSNEPLPQKCHEPFNGGIILLGPGPYQKYKSQLTQATVNIAVAVDIDENPIIHHWFTYTPSPMEMLRKIQLIEPQLKTIHITTNKDFGTHYEENLQQALTKYGLNIKNHTISEPKKASKQFQEIIQMMDEKTEALWISPNHNSLAIDALLPTIIKQSLRHKKMTFANNLSWIDKGIYLGVYPDNIDYGEHIGVIALESLEYSPAVESEGKVKPQIHFIESLKLTANKKTIRFIGKKLDKQTLMKIDLLQPRQ